MSPVRSADIAAIHASAPLLADRVPGLVDAVYDKLFAYDCTKRHFVPAQSGYTGALATDVDSLRMSDDVIAFRKQHLGRYFVNLVSRPYDADLVRYLDNVGRMHTPLAGSPKLAVPLIQMNALMGFVSDALLATIAGLPLAEEIKTGTLRAFNKLLWIQNDLIARHYQGLLA